MVFGKNVAILFKFFALDYIIFLRIYFICPLFSRFNMQLLAAIATYLVILLQFEMAGDDEFRKTVSNLISNTNNTTTAISIIQMVSPP